MHGKSRNHHNLTWLLTDFKKRIVIREESSRNTNEESPLFQALGRVNTERRLIIVLLLRTTSHHRKFESSSPNHQMNADETKYDGSNNVWHQSIIQTEDLLNNFVWQMRNTQHPLMVINCTSPFTYVSVVGLHYFYVKFLETGYFQNSHRKTEKHRAP